MPIFKPWCNFMSQKTLWCLSLYKVSRIERLFREKTKEGRESKNKGVFCFLSKTSTVSKVISNFCESQKIDNNLSKENWRVGRSFKGKKENKSESILYGNPRSKVSLFSPLDIFYRRLSKVRKAFSSLDFKVQLLLTLKPSEANLPFENLAF